MLLPRYKEADLQGHLGNGNKEAASKEKDKKGKDNLLEDDYQLSQALNVLKGMHITASSETQKATAIAAKQDDKAIKTQ